MQRPITKQALLTNAQDKYIIKKHYQERKEKLYVVIMDVKDN